MGRTEMLPQRVVQAHMMSTTAAGLREAVTGSGAAAGTVVGGM